MELREPKRKRRVQVQPQQPFPIPIDSFVEVPAWKSVWRVYLGKFHGNNVVVDNQEDMNALYNMGYFGKGTLSRSAPRYGKWKMDVPPLMYNRQWKRRCEWAELSSGNSASNNQSAPESLNKSIEKSNLVVTTEKNQECGGNNARSRKLHDNRMKETIKNSSGIKHEVVELDDDDILVGSEIGTSNVKTNNRTSLKVNSNIISNRELHNEQATEVTIHGVDSDDPNEKTNDKSVDEVDREGQSVIVLADSDCDNDSEEYLLHLSPRLEQEQFIIQEALHLTLEEAFFLSYGLGCLQVLDLFGNDLSLLQMWKLFGESQRDFVQKYVVYHYFRSKGWVVKPGIKFGGDFLLYKQGPPFYHASYVVLMEVATAAGSWSQEYKTSMNWTRFTGLNRLSETAGKELLLCRVIWPRDVPFNGVSSPKLLEKFTVQEVLMRRWVSSQEREDHDNEEMTS